MKRSLILAKLTEKTFSLSKRMSPIKIKISYRHFKKNGQKSIWLNPINSKTSIRMYPNPIRNQIFNPDQFASIRAWIDPNRIFNQNQSELFRPWIHSDWFWLNIRIGSIWARIASHWKLGFGTVRIHLDWCLGINRIKSNLFWTVFHQTRYKTF